MLGWVLGEGVVSARVLKDRAGFVVGTGIIRSAPLPISLVTGAEVSMISGIALTVHP